MSDWQIFRGDKPEAPQPDRLKLPNAPDWRPSGRSKNRAADRLKQKGATFQVRDEEKRVINSALYLRRPLLVTGNPGVGKSSLAYAVAYELGLGEVLYWPITTRTTLQDGLYSYDAIGRLQDAKPQSQEDASNSDAGEQSQDPLKQDFSNIGKYIQLGALGTALVPSKRPRVLLIDEIDKGDIDLPNDLLCVFEEGGFNIKELTRIKQEFAQVTVQTAYNEGDEQTYTVPNGRIDCDEFPFIVMTSNGERDFPAPFLRRCLQLRMPDPTPDTLKEIVTSQFDEATAAKASQLIQDFCDRLKKKETLATDQLLNVIHMRLLENSADGGSLAALEDRLLRDLEAPGDE